MAFYQSGLEDVKREEYGQEWHEANNQKDEHRGKRQNFFLRVRQLKKGLPNLLPAIIFRDALCGTWECRSNFSRP